MCGVLSWWNTDEEGKVDTIATETNGVDSNNK